MKSLAHRKRLCSDKIKVSVLLTKILTSCTASMLQLLAKSTLVTTLMFQQIWKAKAFIKNMPNCKNPPKPLKTV